MPPRPQRPHSGAQSRFASPDRDLETRSHEGANAASTRGYRIGPRSGGSRNDGDTELNRKRIPSQIHSEAGSALFVGLRGCASLPHSLGCSTFAAVRLSFRVRDGTGRFPYAVTPARGVTNHSFPPSFGSWLNHSLRGCGLVVSLYSGCLMPLVVLCFLVCSLFLCVCWF